MQQKTKRIFSRISAVFRRPLHPARYAVTYENDVSWENRKHWIAGTTIKIIDTKTNTLMAEKTMY
ncbi:hypothetical protein, partial [Neisseria sp. oral taxon 020]|uniref:hypothetical protein n=1 Tax=Neisseria sp. oral taxon 020 TaxID=712401 RepID=UPI001E4F1C00